MRIFDESLPIALKQWQSFDLRVSKTRWGSVAVRVGLNGETLGTFLFYDDVDSASIRFRVTQ